MKQYLLSSAAIAGSLLLVPAAMIDSATAATLVQPFEVEVTSGGLAGQTFFGSARYDESIAPSGLFGAINAADGLTLTFDFLGRTFTEADAVAFPNSPNLFSFFGNTFLAYAVNTDAVGFSLLGPAFSYQVSEAGNETFGFGTVTVGEVSTAPVPEPLTLLGSLTALGLGYAAKRRMAQSTAS
ncbi:PEP-CTERM sorting domain-containing protein [Almyronema epifaneia]|uniref:PEP-CTERM sorting domain-containing protein n=1 Tax=Almyronema epifaneia S1 TaxID=2991925 RepID=A0ABW6I999_9CYAN